MDTSHDKVMLTAEERRILAVLEESCGGHDRRLRLSLAVAARATRLRSSRMGCLGTVMLFVAGAALMVATFTRWPAVAVIGVVMQAGALWWGVALLAPVVGDWVAVRTARSVSDHRTTPPR